MGKLNNFTSAIVPLGDVFIREYTVVCMYLCHCVNHCLSATGPSPVYESSVSLLEDFIHVEFNATEDAIVDYYEIVLTAPSVTTWSYDRTLVSFCILCAYFDMSVYSHLCSRWKKTSLL